MNILTADIGSTYTKLTAIDTVEKKILATSTAFTTIGTDVVEGFMSAYNKLEQRVGEFRYDELLCCSSAAGGLKMVSLGLVPELTAKAAKLAAASAGAKVVKTYAFELSQAEQNEIFEINPDLVLLCGGTDGGNKEVILANARRLCRVERPFTVIAAGNKSASFELEEIFRASGKPFVITENVMPEFNKLNIEPARQKIKELFISRIIKAKGLSRIQKMCETDIIPTPLAVLNACELLSKGTKNVSGLGDLLAVDIGGATTDVYSICSGKPTLENVTLKGLPEPVSKRTVEGDLGMRYSLPSLVGELDMDTLSEELSIDKSIAIDWVTACTQNPDLLAEPGSPEQEIEELIARNAVKIAMERHAGTYQPVYTPFGQVFTLTGKDLSAVPFVIGIGGVIINARQPRYILEGAKLQPDDFMFAKPKDPDYLIDKRYIFASMGLLSSAYPDLALTLLKQEITKQ
ncbi:MAG TPA: DNA mismatch repair protein MutL [Petrimonas sp.]|uniref:methylaspartate mutase accessory protein GlmL n=1 Tax=Petrimonas sp. TaxID=2023866 RepID=UPI001768B1F4|nr:DNA mismatch repair protein MutL [Petrimonas sp.]